MIKDQSQVDIVILNHNGKRFLPGCIESVARSSYPNKQIYLLDNASTQDDVSFVQQRYPEVKVIRNPANNGYCAAYNLAFTQCTGRYIVCLNNDVEVKPDWLDHMVALAESDSTIGAIQPRLVSFFNEQQFEYAGAAGGMMDRFGFPFLRGRIFSHIEHDSGQYNNVCEIFWASGAALFLRKGALSFSGNFDETIVHHMDEIDICWRLRLAGYKVLVQPQSVVKHIGGATIQTHSFRKVYWNHRNSIYIMIKNYGLRHMLVNTPVHMLMDYVAIVQALFTGNFTTVRGIIWAHVWLLWNIPLMLRKRKEVQQRRTYGDSAVIPFLYGRSIVFDHFIRGKKTYSALIDKAGTYENRSNYRSTQWVEGASAGSIH